MRACYNRYQYKSCYIFCNVLRIICTDQSHDMQKTSIYRTKQRVMRQEGKGEKSSCILDTNFSKDEDI